MSNHRVFRAALPVTAALALAATGCAGSAVDSEGDDEGPIRIGAVLDVTGPGATLGGPQRTTLEMLEEQVNEDGGVNGRDVEVIIRDNQSEEDHAARATNELINEEDVDILIGASRSGPSLAMKPIAEENEVPLISLAASAAIIEDTEWVFKTAQINATVVERMIQYSEVQGWTSVALLRDASALGEGVEESITELGEEAGIELVATESFAPDATNFDAQVSALNSANADVTFVWAIPPAGSQAQIALEEASDTPVFHHHGIGSPAFLEEAGDSADGVVLPIARLLVADQLPEDDPHYEVVQSFVEDFQEYDEDGNMPSTFAGHAWDAFQLAVMAFEEAGSTDPEAVRDELMAVEGFVGQSGTFNMSPENRSGLGPDSLVLVTVEDGEWVLLEDQPDE